MENFLYEIIKFIYNFISSFFGAIAQYIRNYGTQASEIGVSNQALNTFLDKDIISGTLLNIGLTYRELLLYLIPILIAILFIIFMVKVIIKLLGVFSLKK